MSKISKAMNKAMASPGASKRKGGGFPTLETLKRDIPKGGLLNPGLRKGIGKMDLKAIRRQTVGK